MKSAEEWKEGCPKVIDRDSVGQDLGWHHSISLERIKQIQLDAWKQGMSDANNRVKFAMKNSKITSESMLLNYLSIDIEMDMKEEQSFKL